MVHVSDPTVSRRERTRRRRAEHYLEVGLRIVSREGFDAFTMQRLADEADAAIGTVYRYFPSKGVLLAELERSVVERLDGSLAHLLERIADVPGDDGAALRLVAHGRWFSAAAVTFPNELDLLQRFMSDSRHILPVEETHRVLPAVYQVLGRVHDGIADAQARALVTDADPMARVVVLAASVSGVLQVTKVGVFDPDLFDGHALARRLNDDLLLGWGLDPDQLDRANTTLDEFATVEPLAIAAPTPGAEG